jgi:hypothetical protein
MLLPLFRDLLPALILNQFCILHACDPKQFTKTRFVIQANLQAETLLDFNQQNGYIAAIAAAPT